MLPLQVIVPTPKVYSSTAFATVPVVFEVSGPSVSVDAFIHVWGLMQAPVPFPSGALPHQPFGGGDALLPRL